MVKAITHVARLFQASCALVQQCREVLASVLSAGAKQHDTPVVRQRYEGGGEYPCAVGILERPECELLGPSPSHDRKQAVGRVVAVEEIGLRSEATHLIEDRLQVFRRCVEILPLGGARDGRPERLLQPLEAKSRHPTPIVDKGHDADRALVVLGALPPRGQIGGVDVTTTAAPALLQLGAPRPERCAAKDAQQVRESQVIERAMALRARASWLESLLQRHRKALSVHIGRGRDTIMSWPLLLVCLLDICFPSVRRRAFLHRSGLALGTP